MYQRKKNRSGFHRSLFLRVLLLCLPLVLVFVVMAQTAFAKTYVITDGDRVFTYTTNETNPESVLDEAGLELAEQDTYTTHSDDDATAITVRRAQAVTVDYRGEVIAVHTYGETVGSLLATLNILLTPQDTINCSLEDPTGDGMEIRIDQVVTRTEVYTSTLAHEVSYCHDASLPEGTEEVLVPGSDGEMLCTAEVTYINGVETQRDILSRTVIRDAVEEVIAVGTEQLEAEETDASDPNALPVIGEDYIILPTGEVLTYTDTAQVRATAYTHTDAGCDLITATGSTVHIGTVAVDPRYIPYGTRMFIVANDGSYVYGISEAEDCGGAIKGDRVDLYFPTYAECMEFGWRKCTIYFLG